MTFLNEYTNTAPKTTVGVPVLTHVLPLRHTHLPKELISVKLREVTRPLVCPRTKNRHLTLMKRVRT